MNNKKETIKLRSNIYIYIPMFPDNNDFLGICNGKYRLDS